MTRTELITMAAESTHNQWVLRIKRQGWHFGKYYEEDRKISPRIRNFRSLDSKDQEYCLFTATVTVDILLNTGYISGIEEVVVHPHSKMDLIWLIDKMKELLEVLTQEDAEFNASDVYTRSQEVVLEAEEIIRTEVAVNPRKE